MLPATESARIDRSRLTSAVALTAATALVVASLLTGTASGVDPALAPPPSIEITQEMEDVLAAQTSALEAQIEHESTALDATGRVWDDGIIHPADSRTVLGMALSAAHSNLVRGATEYGVWRH